MSGFLDQIQWQLLNNLMFSEKFPESNEISGYCLYLWKLKKRAVVFKLITRASYVLPLELIWWNRFTSLIASHGVQMDPISLLKLNGSCLPI